MTTCGKQKVSADQSLGGIIFGYNVRRFAHCGDLGIMQPVHAATERPML